LCILAVAIAILAALAIDSGKFNEWVIRLCCLGLFAMSLNLLVGYTGLLSFGHATFFGLGAYAFCILMQSKLVNVPVAIAGTLAVTGFAAVIIGLICVRLTHIYFAFITLAIQMLLYSLLIAWSTLTGGEQGLIGGIPRPPFWGVNLGDPFHFYVFNVVIFVGSVAIMYIIVRSPFGVALRMIRDNPQRATFLRVNVPRFKLAVFVIASLFSGLAGVLMGLYVSGAYPNFAFWTTSGEGLFMIMLGGARVFLGPAVGAALMIVLDSMVNTYTGHHGIVLGGIILFTVLILRRGALEYAYDWTLSLRAARTAKASSANEKTGNVSEGLVRRSLRP
jgi:branched-chain amino acid transport system permease protein